MSVRHLRFLLVSATPVCGRGQAPSEETFASAETCFTAQRSVSFTTHSRVEDAFAGCLTHMGPAGHAGQTLYLLSSPCPLHQSLSREGEPALVQTRGSAPPSVGFCCRHVETV